jgi:hypothetical protein
MDPNAIRTDAAITIPVSVFQETGMDEIRPARANRTTEIRISSIPRKIIMAEMIRRDGGGLENQPREESDRRNSTRTRCPLFGPNKYGAGNDRRRPFSSA